MDKVALFASSSTSKLHPELLPDGAGRCSPQTDGHKGRQDGDYRASGGTSISLPFLSCCLTSSNISI